jgi:divalent metal cation (Fe/Co/Zn/Cd) transporter
VIEAHDLRTRKSGAYRHIDFHLVVCRYMTVEESHAVCDQIEVALEKSLPRTSASIHVEPCEVEITHCNERCPIYTKRKL